MTPRVPLAARLRPVACLALLGALAACGSHTSSTQRAARPHYSPQHYYPPPGPPSDPWGPYIKEASGRFSVPEPWIRNVMKQESGGQQDVISWAGAMGLMQVMPDTYAELQDRYHLGDDPFDPHNNILAGTAYLREMYDRFGSPGFLAAYNAGPNRVDQYVNNGRPLPAETVHYVAAIAPRLGPGTPMSGPLAAYGGRGVEVASAAYRDTTTRTARAPTPAGCDPDAAYNPDGPCTPLAPPVQYAMAPASPAPVVQASLPAPSSGVPTWTPSLISSAEASPARPSASSSSAAATYHPAPAAPQYAYAAPAACDPEAAFDPSHPCWPSQRATYSAPQRAPAPQAGTFATSQVTAYAPPRQVTYSVPPATAYSVPQANAYAPPVEHRPIQEGMRTIPASAMRAAASSSGVTAASALGHWAIQVGAFGTLPTAHAAAERARAALPNLLGTANIELPRTAPFGNQVAFQARLTGLPQNVAADACAKLSTQGVPCMTVPPNRT